MESSLATIRQVWASKWKAFSYYRGRLALLKTLLRWGVWRIRCLLRLPAVVEIPRFRMRLYLLPQWRGCWKGIFVFRERFFEISDPELALVRDSLRGGDVFIDAGAYHGWYSLLASSVVGDTGFVMAFEPNPDAYAILTRNITLSNRQNIRAFNVALADTAGQQWLYKGPGDESPSALAYVPGGTGKALVSTRRLDDLLDELGIRQVALMKLDVQGAELSLLHGAMGVLRNSRPLLIFEVDPDAAQLMGVPVRGTWDLLASLGYAFFRFSDGVTVPLREFPPVQQGTFLNVVAVPEGYERS